MNRTELVRPQVSASHGDPRHLPGEINRLLTHIRHMESSKFWRLRSAFVRVKRLLCLPADDIRL